MNLRLLVAALLLSTGLAAQVPAPNFLCTRSEGGGEILSWENVPVSCGVYMGTEIYWSTDEAGPYTLLTTLTDRSVTEYRDENPTGEQRFYYLQYDYDCVDTEVRQSDTLDKNLPAAPEINFLSVENGGLRLSWLPSSSPEVNGYTIFEVTPAGIFPIDTVGNVTSYRIDNVPDDELTTRQYRIATLDPCDNDSPQSRIVSATELFSSGGRGCDSDIELTKGSYVIPVELGPPIGPDELYVSVDGGDFDRAPYDTTNPDILYTLGNDGERLCFFLLTRYANGDSVLTDTVCTTLDIIQPVRPFATYGVEMEADGTLRFAYDNTGNQPQVNYHFLEVKDDDSIETVYVLPALDFFADDEIRISNIEYDALLDTFQLSVDDTCSRLAESNDVRPVILTGQQDQSGAVTLNWTPLVNGLPGETTYDILRVTPDGGLETIGSVVDGDLVFIDPDLGNTGGCYNIRANFTPADRDTTFSFLSNLTCVEGRTELYLPNVFSPIADQPENRVFGPLFTVPTAVTAYQLLVFDRWGALYFESDDPIRGWDGTLGGSDAPTGTYVYVLTYQAGQSNLVERSGVVTLLR